MKNCDVLIIGAGAAGLMAGRILAKAGKKVTVLEARERSGGRIHTLNNELFFKSTELGAEFVHGDLPVTLSLLDEAGIKYNHSSMEMWRYKDGKFINDDDAIPHWDLFMEKLDELESDTDLDSFLNQEFVGVEFDELKRSVKRYVAGYDTADPAKASAFALRQEWKSEDDGAQHRVEGGYCTMIRYLEEEIRKAKGFVLLNSIVKDINWEKEKVKLTTTDGDVFEASQLIVAMPLGVLQAGNEEKGAVKFDPPVFGYNQALNAMGFGSIIKILLEFDEPFWETQPADGKSLKDMGFLLSEEVIPTWWTQKPGSSSVITGWLGGLPAEEKKNFTDAELLTFSLQSLGTIFKYEVSDLKNKLVAYHVANWANDPFTRGSYAYDTVAAPKSRLLLNKSIEDTIFFAGEYLYEGPAMGTVEAALSSGKNTAEKLLNGN